MPELHPSNEDVGAVIALEHEVRALTHPMFNRPLVNRNPAVGFGDCRQGQEVYVPA